LDPAASSEQLLTWLANATWWITGAVAIFYFVCCYLFEILAQKLDEPRWMAWVPLANFYLMLKLVGWEKWLAWILGGYAVMLLGFFLPGPLAFVAMLVVIPLALGGIALGLGYWPKLAVRRDLPVWVGLLMVLPQLVAGAIQSIAPEAWLVPLLATLVAFGAFLAIVFHDGPPKVPPHPIGYAITLASALGTALMLNGVSERLVESAGFQQEMQEMMGQLEGEEFSAAALFGDLWGESLDQAPEIVPSAWQRRSSGEPPIRHVATVCPADAREFGTSPEDLEWGCEIETGDAWVRHGPHRSFFESGQLESEGMYEQGRRIGTWTRYWPTGRRRAQAEFRDGEQAGWMHRWNADGRLASEVYYVDDEPVPASLAGS